MRKKRAVRKKGKKGSAGPSRARRASDKQAPRSNSYSPGTEAAARLPTYRLTSPNRIGITYGARISAVVRVKRERQLGTLITRGAVPYAVRLAIAAADARVDVTIVRISKFAFDDDNMVSACKALRDGIADAFGVKDNSPKIGFAYRQQRGFPREYEVVVEYAFSPPWLRDFLMTKDTQGGEKKSITGR